MTRKILIFITLLIFTHACTNNQPDKKSIEIDQLNDLMKYDRNAKIKIFINGKPVEYDYNHISKTPWQIVVDEILYIHGIKNGLNKKFEGKGYNPKFVKRLVIDELRQEYRTEIPPSFEVTKEEAEEYYNNNIDNYTSYSYYEVTVDGDLSEAEKLRTELIENKKIKELLAKYENSDKVKFKFLGRKSKPVDGVTFEKISEREVSKIAKTDNNKYRIVKIGAKKVILFEKIEEYIKITLSKLKVAEVFGNKVQKLKEKDNLEVKIVEES